ncbi:MAG: hypothetical protein LBV04_02495, partial [Deferribacteraceae bacterium]|nr:hypothetical protein [Deferribacteraceae bacterium]
KKGKKNELCKYYFENGTIKCELQYLNGKLNREQKIYNEDVSLYATIVCKLGKKESGILADGSELTKAAMKAALDALDTE